MEKSIEQIEKEALKELEIASDSESVKSLSVRFLGRKGELTQFLRNISNFEPEKRPEIGKKANQVKKALEIAFEIKIKKIEETVCDNEDNIDITLPGRSVCRGYMHPVTQITRQICDILIRLGFDVAQGPEVETDYYNFEALNFPKDHPARDMQDTFFVSEDIVLRTHTSPLQVRIMEKQSPPVRIIMPGRVYRCDSDLTHTPMFHQVECLFVDKNVSFGDLKGVLTAFIHQMFDDQIALRFRPSFFPFTEPSAEVDIICVMCRGNGCRVCSHTGWLEVIGSGMVHPAVFENVGYDASIYTGFAFGMGVERLAMLKFGIDDIRRFFDNDFNFLSQF